MLTSVTLPHPSHQFFIAPIKAMSLMPMKFPDSLSPSFESGRRQAEFRGWLASAHLLGGRHCLLGYILRRALQRVGGVLGCALRRVARLTRALLQIVAATRPYQLITQSVACMK